MRRSVIGILLLLLALCAGAAFAEGQTDPTRPQMLESLQVKQKLKEEYHHPGQTDTSKYIKPTISIDGSMLPCKTLTFKASGVSNEYEYWWGISDEGRDPGGYIYYPVHDNLVGKNEIRYTFHSAGKYSVTLFLVQKDQAIGYSYKEFTIKDDGKHPTLEDKAQEIVNECKSSTKWQTALKLYDWLTSHAYYDATYDTHGADILFIGYGVCDSYSKAYELLCKTAGIPVERCFGPNHAWNTLKLDGKWYQADATWDDPGSAMPGQGSAISGLEGHEFFCLSAAAMIPVSSHSYEGGTQDGPHAADCTSMDANYFIHEGMYKGFGEYSYDYSSGSGKPTVKTYASQIQNAINAGGSYSKTIPRYVYYFSGGSINSTYFSYPSIFREILKAGLSKEKYTLGGTQVKVKTTVTIDGSRLVLSARITGWKIDETGTLTIPGSMTSISSKAFYGNGATRVVLPKNCGKIGSKAFADSAVRTVEIPGPVTSIADDAFEGCGEIMFISTDGKVKTFAAEHGFIVVAP